jgi:hypothetical protein
MAYLIAERRCSAEAVFDELKRARPVCDPNLGYWVTLKEWEQQLGIEAEPERRGEPGASTLPREAREVVDFQQPTSPTVVGGKRVR